MGTQDIQITLQAWTAPAWVTAALWIVGAAFILALIVSLATPFGRPFAKSYIRWGSALVGVYALCAAVIFTTFAYAAKIDGQNQVYGAIEQSLKSSPTDESLPIIERALWGDAIEARRIELVRLENDRIQQFEISSKVDGGRRVVRISSTE